MRKIVEVFSLPYIFRLFLLITRTGKTRWEPPFEERNSGILTPSNIRTYSRVIRNNKTSPINWACKWKIRQRRTLSCAKWWRYSLNSVLCFWIIYWSIFFSQDERTDLHSRLDELHKKNLELNEQLHAEQTRRQELESKVTDLSSSLNEVCLYPSLSSASLLQRIFI